MLGLIFQNLHMIQYEARGVKEKTPACKIDGHSLNFRLLYLRGSEF